ncbi:MAG: DUF1801 domain-containing protein [Lachnospiraceae bacterium]|nr:DUF1801 domain-containing protein [Lachnospiraceae bacterium]
MREDVKEYIDKYSNDIKEMYLSLRKLLIDSVPCDVEENLWAKLPSYNVGDSFVRIIPFKDHINIEATAIDKYRNELKDFKITSKGMLQIYLKQNIPQDILKHIFKETLIG